MQFCVPNSGATFDLFRVRQLHESKKFVVVYPKGPKTHQKKLLQAPDEIHCRLRLRISFSNNALQGWAG